MPENKANNKVRPQTRHLIPIKKGERLNPNGRPLGQRNYATIYREALIKLASINNCTPEELEEQIDQKAISLARKGDYRFYKDIKDRLHGMAKQSVDVTSGGKPLPTPIFGGQSVKKKKMGK